MCDFKFFLSCITYKLVKKKKQESTILIVSVLFDNEILT